jgi:hypothetical protein
MKLTEIINEEIREDLVTRHAKMVLKQLFRTIPDTVLKRRCVINGQSAWRFKWKITKRFRVLKKYSFGSLLCTLNDVKNNRFYVLDVYEHNVIDYIVNN